MAYELYSQGLTQQQIAEQLGVCSKTVAKDLRRTQAYHKGQFTKMLRTVQAERDAEYTKRCETLPLPEQRKQLLQDFKFISKMLGTRRRLQETMCFTIRLDEIMKAATDKNAYGRPFIRLDTKTMTLPLNRFRLKIRFTAGDQRIGQATYCIGNWKK